MGAAIMLDDFLVSAAATEFRIADSFHLRSWRVMVLKLVTTKRTRTQ
jgi:hypothetical protein